MEFWTMLRQYTRVAQTLITPDRKCSCEEQSRRPGKEKSEVTLVSDTPWKIPHKRRKKRRFTEWSLFANLHDKNTKFNGHFSDVVQREVETNSPGESTETSFPYTRKTFLNRNNEESHSFSHECCSKCSPSHLKYHSKLGERVESIYLEVATGYKYIR